MSSRLARRSRRRSCPTAEADAVVGHHRHHRAVVDPRLVEAVEQLAEQPVGVRDLEQVALVGLLDEEPARIAGTPVDARQRLPRGAPVDAARGQVLVRHVRQQDVDQVQLRARGVLDLRDEPLEAVGAAASQVGVDADEAVALGLARDQARDGDRLRGVLAGLELVLHLVGQQLVADRAGHAVPERLVLVVPAQGRRAERGRVLAHVQLVAAAGEQAEDVARVIGRDRQALLARQAPVEDRRDGVGGVLVDGGGVAVPGRVAGEPGEVRVAPSVDAAVRAHQRVDGELVEDHEHDRGARAHVGGLHVGRGGEDQIRGVRGEQEQGHERERGGAEQGQQRPGGREARIDHRRCDPGDERERQRGRGAEREHAEHDRARQRGHEHDVQRPGGGLAHQADQPLDCEQRERRDERDEQRERHDLSRRRGSRGEELRVAPERVEQRRGHGQRPQHRDVHPRSSTKRRLIGGTLAASGRLGRLRAVLFWLASGRCSSSKPP